MPLHKIRRQFAFDTNQRRYFLVSQTVDQILISLSQSGARSNNPGLHEFL
jgi:hypothetical protein